jgi:hypothetical protein
MPHAPQSVTLLSSSPSFFLTVSVRCRWCVCVCPCFTHPHPPTKKNNKKDGSCGRKNHPVECLIALHGAPQRPSVHTLRILLKQTNRKTRLSLSSLLQWSAPWTVSVPSHKRPQPQKRKKSKMNVFHNNPAQFRRGSALDDRVTVAPARPDITTPSNEGVAAHATVAPPHPISTPLPSLIDVATSLAPPPPPPQQQQPLKRFYPSTPYYGLLTRCEVHIDVAVEGCDWEGVAGAAPPYNVRSTIQRLQDLQRCLSDCTETHGAVYHFGTSAGPYEPGPQTSSVSSASAPPSSITYGAYVEAMQDGLRQMMLLRASCTTASAMTQHCFYVRLIGHPRWKDLSALLCVEKARLLLCVLSSSRVTQKHLTSVCAEAKVEIEWLSGAALVVEPATLAADEVNPLWAVWDAVLHLPLLPSVSSPAVADDDITTADTAKGGEAPLGPSRTGVGSSVFAPSSSFPHATMADVSAGVRGALETMQLASLPLQQCHLSLVSSLRFCHARRCCPVGRFVEEAVLFASDAVMTTGGSIGKAASSTIAAATTSRHPVARRYVWRVLPSHTWVLPHFLTQLTQCLVERCELRSFTLRCGGPSADVTPSPASAGVSGDVAKKPGSAVGVRLVHGDVPLSVSVRHGPSTVSWVAFSRLSGAAWVDKETREGLTTGDPFDDQGEAEEEVELEFELNAIQYTRCASPERRTATAVSMRKRSRGGEPKWEDSGVTADSTVDMVTWGPSFTFGVSVKRLITMDDVEE